MVPARNHNALPFRSVARWYRWRLESPYQPPGHAAARAGQAWEPARRDLWLIDVVQFGRWMVGLSACTTQCLHGVHVDGRIGCHGAPPRQWIPRLTERRSTEVHGCSAVLWGQAQQSALSISWNCSPSCAMKERTVQQSVPSAVNLLERRNFQLSC